MTSAQSGITDIGMETVNTPEFIDKTKSQMT